MDLLQILYELHMISRDESIFNKHLIARYIFLITILLIKFQACEQLNSWLGGFESSLKCMKSGKFDWFLHVLPFYHTLHVIQKQGQKEKPYQIDDNDEDGANDEEEENYEAQHWNPEY